MNLTPAAKTAMLRRLQRAAALLIEDDNHRLLEDAERSSVKEWAPRHGRVRVVGGGDVPDVDDEALLAWVQENRPDQLVTVVRPEYRRKLVDRLTVDNGKVVDRLTGELVPYAKPVTSKRRVEVHNHNGRSDVEEAANLLEQQLDTIAALLDQDQPAQDT